MNSEHRPADTRSPFVFDVHELSRHSGSMKEVTEEIPAPAHWSVGTIGVPEGSPIDLRARFESVIEGIWVSGTASVTLAGECARCLNPLTDEGSFGFEELFVHPGRDADEDASFVADDHIDLESLVRDAVVLELPFTPLCRPDCAGLCSDCGANLNEDPEHTHGEQIDPRREALRSMQGDN